MSGFFVIARQPGAENPAIPTWAHSDANPVGLQSQRDVDPVRVNIDGVPGAFQLLNVLSLEECQRLISMTESLGYHEDAAVSLPRSVRHNHSFTWVVDDVTNDIIWQRCHALFNDHHPHTAGKTPLGLNARWRFYRYSAGDYFAPHTDGSWPGSRVVDGQLIDNAYDDRWSQFTILLFLSDDFEGGGTQFFVNGPDGLQPATRGHDVTTPSLRTPVGGALCFPHGMHPQHCVHASEKVTAGTKYIIRSDVLFSI